MKFTRQMFSRRKIFTFLSILTIFFLIGVRLNERKKHSQVFVSAFSEMVYSTEKALLEFSAIDERYLKGEESAQGYEKAWFDLNFKLEEIKRQDDKLQAPPKKLEELVSLYRAGFYRVLSVSNDVVDFLGGANEDPTVIIKNRTKFEDGLKMLREVREGLNSSEKLI